MAICYITQTEVYNSFLQDDRLNTLNAESSSSLQEDLNYIRSVIFKILGLDPSDPNNKWYKVPYYTLTFLFERYNDLYNNYLSLSNTVGSLDTRLTNLEQDFYGSGGDEPPTTDLRDELNALTADFSVQHYTSSENPNLAGYHKNIIATGNANIAGNVIVGGYIQTGKEYIAFSSVANIQ